MNEIVKFECACDIGYDKGVLKKTIENNIFTVFGNLNQKNSIVIRYHGTLTENENNNSTTYSMFYYFDEAKNDKKIVTLQKCAKCVGECYCTTIDLDMNHTLNFGFFNGDNKYEINGDNSFKLQISPDPISNLMQRYGFEQNTNLPTYEENKDKIFAFKSLLNIIKEYFSNLLKKKHTI